MLFPGGGTRCSWQKGPCKQMEAHVWKAHARGIDGRYAMLVTGKPGRHFGECGAGNREEGAENSPVGWGGDSQRVPQSVSGRSSFQKPEAGWAEKGLGISVLGLFLKGCQSARRMGAAQGGAW